MLGHRFFVCERCGTVYANPPTSRCDRCETVELREITHTVQSDPYFAPPRSRDRETE